MTDALDPHEDPSDLGIVPLFPLPGVVLFPRAVLPLHIFEERYKAMTLAALEGDRRIAMALLRPGWEKTYHSSQPEIEPIVCVGSILTHERLADGKYNFLLQGVARARVVSEIGGHSYRLARLKAVEEVPIEEEDLWGDRKRIADAFERGPLAGSCSAKQFLRLLAGGLPTAELADLMAFTYLDDADLKQSLLAEPDVRRRVSRTLVAMEDFQPVIPSAAFRAFRTPGVN